MAVFGHAPIRDAAAKAIATYEHTVLLATGIQDRAEATMRKRVIKENAGTFELKAASIGIRGPHLYGTTND